MYLLHPPVLFAMSLGFVFLKFHPIIKLVIIFPLTVIICYLLSHFVLEKIHFKKTFNEGRIKKLYKKKEIKKEY